MQLRTLIEEFAPLGPHFSSRSASEVVSLVQKARMLHMSNRQLQDHPKLEQILDYAIAINQSMAETGFSLGEPRFNDSDWSDLGPLVSKGKNQEQIHEVLKAYLHLTIAGSKCRTSIRGVTEMFESASEFVDYSRHACSFLETTAEHRIGLCNLTTHNSARLTAAAAMEGIALAQPIVQASPINEESFFTTYTGSISHLFSVPADVAAHSVKILDTLRTYGWIKENDKSGFEDARRSIYRVFEVIENARQIVHTFEDAAQMIKTVGELRHEPGIDLEDILNIAQNIAPGLESAQHFDATMRRLLVMQRLTKDRHYLHLAFSAHKDEEKVLHNPQKLELYLKCLESGFTYGVTDFSFYSDFILPQLNTLSDSQPIRRIAQSLHEHDKTDEGKVRAITKLMTNTKHWYHDLQTVSQHMNTLFATQRMFDSMHMGSSFDHPAASKLLQVSRDFPDLVRMTRILRHLHAPIADTLNEYNFLHSVVALASADPKEFLGDVCQLTSQIKSWNTAGLDIYTLTQDVLANLDAPVLARVQTINELIRPLTAHDPEAVSYALSLAATREQTSPIDLSSYRERFARTLPIATALAGKTTSLYLNVRRHDGGNIKSDTVQEYHTEIVDFINRDFIPEPRMLAMYRKTSANKRNKFFAQLAQKGQQIVAQHVFNRTDLVESYLAYNHAYHNFGKRHEPVRSLEDFRRAFSEHASGHIDRWDYDDVTRTALERFS